MFKKIENESGIPERAEILLKHLSAVLGVIREIDRLVKPAPDRETLLQETCTLLQDGVYRHAWAMVFRLDGSRCMTGSTETAAAPCASAACGAPPACVDRAGNTAGLLTAADFSELCPGCPLSAQCDPAETMLVRLEYAGTLYGILSAGVAPWMTGCEEVRLVLFELARDLSFAMYTIEAETARRQAERILRESEARYRTLYEHISNGVVIFEAVEGGEDFIFVDFNKAAEQIDGITKKALVGHSMLELFPAAPELGIFAALQRVWRSGGPEHLPVYVYEQGKIKAWKEHYVYKLPSGEIVAVCSDETERKIAEESLRGSEERFRSITESISDAIVQADSSGKIIFWNKSAESMYGYAADEIIGKPVQLLLPESLRRIDTREMRSYVKTGRSSMKGHTVEAPNLRKDGTEFFAEQSLSSWKRGGETFFTAIVRDVSARKQAEEERVRLSSAVEQAAESIIIMDSQGVIRYANPATGIIIGYTRERMIGMNPFQVTDAPHENYFYREIWDTISRGSTWKGQMKNRRGDGALALLEVTISPIINKQSEIINYVFIAHDITNEIELEKRLRQAQKMESIGTLAGGIAHDFNNILAAIIGYSEMGLYDEGEAGHSFEQILKAGERARDLINQILTFSRQTEAAPQAIHAALIVQETLKLLRASLPKHITIRTELSDAADTVIADPTQIHQVMMNLCTNAAQAMAQQGGVLTVTMRPVAVEQEISDLQPGQYVQLSIADSGTGIDPKLLERIFDPFFTTKGPAEGTGMGLSVAHGIVTRMGGAITVESTLGQGTTFHVYLPRIDDQVPDAGMPIELLPGGSERVLFIDDERDLCEVGERMLRSLGYRVSAHTGSMAALAAFEAHPDAFDIVVTDQTMPEMPGTGLIKSIRRVRPDIPVVLCTGYSNAVTPQLLSDLHIQALIMKPIRRQVFAEKIRQLLDERG